MPLVGMAQAGSRGFFDDEGYPAGAGWDEIPFPDLATNMLMRWKSPADSMLPVYRDGDRIVVSPGCERDAAAIGWW